MIFTTTSGRRRARQVEVEVDMWTKVSRAEALGEEGDDAHANESP